jgi:phosphoribosylamine---glycine ligase
LSQLVYIVCHYGIKPFIKINYYFLPYIIPRHSLSLAPIISFIFCMNILLLGAGGREHCFALQITKSKLCTQLYVAPGNAGTSSCAINVALDSKNFESIHQYCKQQEIGLIVVGPEEPLVLGIVDYFLKTNIKIVGPNAYAAQLEGSKAFAKTFMRKHNIPTATYASFDEHTYKEGRTYIEQHSLPIVIKADGLAAGKGVIICTSYEEALEAYDNMLLKAQFGAASKQVIVEQYLDGIECSVFVLTDGRNYVLFPEAKDYKRIGEGDKGPNTGGMGAISPVPFFKDSFKQKVIDKIIQPTVDGLFEESMHYKGFIFFGLIKVGNEPYVIEYNCRMGDPETEVVLPRIESDLVALMQAAFDNNLKQTAINISANAAATIVAVAEGYPGDYPKGDSIFLAEDAFKNSVVMHAGTTLNNNELQTNGGRVLCVTSLAATLAEAVANSKASMQHVHYKGKYFRNDIGYEFI